MAYNIDTSWGGKGLIILELLREVPGRWLRSLKYMNFSEKQVASNVGTLWEVGG